MIFDIEKRLSRVSFVFFASASNELQYNVQIYHVEFKLINGYAGEPLIMLTILQLLLEQTRFFDAGIQFD